MTEPLSARQLLALSYRAKPGDVDGNFFFFDGVATTRTWLRILMQVNQGDAVALKLALRERIAQGIVWNASDYQDGVAAVLDDIAGILDNDHATINDIINCGRDRRRAEKEA